MPAHSPPVRGQPSAQDVPPAVQRGGRAGQRDRGQDGAELAVELGELGEQVLAGRAMPEVGLHGRLAARAQPAAGSGAEVLGARAARRRDVRADVLLQVGLPESLPGPHRQRGNPVAGQAEHRRHLGGRLALDLQLPQHPAPPLRQPGEGPDDQAGLGAGFGLGLRIAAEPRGQEGRTVAGFLIQVPDHRHPAPGGYPVVRQVAHGREQMGGTRDRPAARLDGGDTRANASATMSSATSGGTIDSASPRAAGAYSTDSSPYDRPARRRPAHPAFLT